MDVTASSPLCRLAQTSGQVLPSPSSKRPMGTQWNMNHKIYQISISIAIPVDYEKRWSDRVDMLHRRSGLGQCPPATVLWSGLVD